MAEILKAVSRAKAGKGASRAIRREQKLVPGVVYGAGKASEIFSMDARVILAAMKKKGFYTRQFELQINEGKEQTVICKEVQTHPVTDAFMHIDFSRVDANKIMVVKVPVVLANVEKAVGIKKGGTINLVHRFVKLSCKVANVPHEIRIDVASLDMGHSIHASTIKLDEGVMFAHGWADETIVTMSGKMSAKDDEADKAAAVAAKAASDAAKTSTGAAKPAAKEGEKTAAKK
jgi:large subunit ribosomal protein L25